MDNKMNIEWVLVYLPSMKIVSRSCNKQDIIIEYKAIGHDYDEDYSMMTSADYYAKCIKLGIQR